MCLVIYIKKHHLKHQVKVCHLVQIVKEEFKKKQFTDEIDQHNEKLHNPKIKEARKQKCRQRIEELTSNLNTYKVEEITQTQLAHFATVIIAKKET